MTGGVVSGGGRRRGGGTTSAFLHPDASARPDPRTNLPSTCAIIEGGITHLPPPLPLLELRICAFSKIGKIREKLIVSYRLSLGSPPLYVYISLSLLDRFISIPFSEFSLFRAWPYFRSLSFRSPFLLFNLSLSLSRVHIHEPCHPSIHPSLLPSTLAPFRSLLLRLSFVRRITAIENR